MRSRDIFTYSFGAIRLRKLRAGLTTLGIVVGIAAIVALLSFTQGLQDTVAVQFQKGLATDTLIVSTGGGFRPSAEGGTNAVDSGFKLLVNDTQTINEIESAEMSMAMIQRVCYVGFGERSRTATMVGVDFAKYADIYSSTFVAESGDIPRDPENETIVVGNRVSDPWKNETILCNANDTVEIVWTNATARPPKNETYTAHVAAVLKEVGGLGVGGPSDSSVYIPISQAQSYFGTDECDMILVKLANDDEATIDSVSDAITEAFSGQVTVTSATAVLDTVSTVFSTMQLFLSGIAAISLLVAGIGIMNIMIVSLMERTREIGILKALGMKSRTVLLVFLCESVIVGLIGAVIGVASGWGLANLVAVVFASGGGMRPGGIAIGAMTITPVLTPTVAILALAFGIGVSVIFALYPAWRASKLKPVEALRYE